MGCDGVRIQIPLKMNLVNPKHALKVIALFLCRLSSMSARTLIGLLYAMFCDFSLMNTQIF